MCKSADVAFQDTSRYQHSQSDPGHCRELGKYPPNYDGSSTEFLPLHNRDQSSPSYVNRKCAFCDEETS